MKKSRKLLCVLLALVMVVSLLPVMAFAADEDVAAEETTAATVEETSPETEGVVSDVILFAKLPNYLVAVKTSDGRVAAGAQVVIYKPEQGSGRDCRRQLRCRHLLQEGSPQHLLRVRYLDAGVHRHAV